MRILTLDLGTGAIKVCLWREATQEVCRSLPITTHMQGDRAEQDPNEWWDKSVLLVREIVRDYPQAADIDGIGVTGHMHTLTPTDADGEPLGTVAVVPDRRARIACRELNAEFGIERILRWTGGRLDPTCALAKARHFYCEGDAAWRKASWFLPPKDFLRMRLTGEAATDPTDAAGTMLWNLQTQTWQPELAAFVGCPLAKLPPTLPTLSPAGSLRPDAARLLGLRAGTPVVVGGGDDIETLGAGALNVGDVYEHLGTTGSVYVAADAPYFDAEGRVETYPDVKPGRWLLGGSTSAAGLSQRWALTLLGREGDWESVERLFARMQAEGKPAPILFLPYLAGERAPLWDMGRSGALLGLRAEHGPETVLQATVEGVLFSLRAVLDSIETMGLSLPAGCVHTSGPFGAGESLGQVRADIYGREVVRLGDTEDTTSFAAMMTARCALTGEDPYDTARRFLPQRWRQAPRPDAWLTYQRGYCRFVQATTLLSEFDG